MRRFESIVVGLGAMGSATAFHLARRGNRVLGLDRYAPPHVHGSTHGDTRITRLAIGEGAHYTPLALRSHQLWREIERETGRTLLTTNGGLILSSRAKTSASHGENFFANTLAAAREFGIAHEMLDATQIRRRFPQFRVVDDEVGYHERDAGFLRPEECVRVQLALARQHGAEVHPDERALGFDATDGGVTVTTDRGTYAADHLIVAAGAWLPQFVDAAFIANVRVCRQTLFWFDIEGAVTPFLPENFPVFIWELQGKKQGIYGFPAIDGPRGGVKIATEQFDATTTADTVEREVPAAEARSMFDDYVAPHVLGLTGRCVKAASCLYTLTPDFGFVIDTLPGMERVTVASPCSGHGFKHSAAIGEALAERVIDGASHLDLSACRIERFGASAIAAQ